MKKNILNIVLIILVFGLSFTFFPFSPAAEQIDLPRVEAMPNEPSPYVLRDWKKTGRDYIHFSLDETKQGEHLPLMQWLNESNGWKMFFLPSYVGLKEPKTEAINAMALVASGALLGLDMTDFNGTDFVKLTSDYFYCPSEGMYSNDQGGCGTPEFWYKILPNLLFYQISDLHPQRHDLKTKVLRIADQLHQASLSLGGSKEPWAIPEYEHWSFDFAKMESRNDRAWKEAGSAGAFAWMSYMAFSAGGEPKHLDTADWAMEYLSRRDISKNPLYEIMLRYAPITAARMNAELGRNYDLHKMLLWCTGVSDGRYGWGVISDAPWGDYDCDGLAGSTTDTNGYAFTMNTFQAASTSVPVVRYDQRYARTIGKWMLNLINAARLFYANGLPGDLQDNQAWCDAYDPNYCVAYEGLRKHAIENNAKRPYATGDAIRNGLPNNIGLYGSSHVGFLAALVEPTNVEKILQLDCLATDFYHKPAYPTYLYYNPFDDTKTVKIDLGASSFDLYDSVTHTFIARNVSNAYEFKMAPDEAMILVLTPPEGKVSYQKNKLLIDEVVIDYRNEGKQSGAKAFDDDME